jgi:predicted PP-loop superfamily ATPase
MSTEAHDTPFEREFRERVRSASHSFGRMAQIIDEEWRKVDPSHNGLLVICGKCKTLINAVSGRPVPGGKERP